MIAHLTPNSVRADFVYSCKNFTSPNFPYISLPVPETLNRHKLFVSVQFAAVTPQIRAYIRASRNGTEVLRLPYQVGVNGTRPNIRISRSGPPASGGIGVADWGEGMFVRHSTLNHSGCAVHYFCGNIDRVEFVSELRGTSTIVVMLGVFSDSYL